MAECPNNVEELQELEKLIPLCRVTLYNQAKARDGSSSFIAFSKNVMPSELIFKEYHGLKRVEE